MIDKDKIMKSIECCLRPDNTNLCGECSYKEVAYDCKHALIKDVHELLKEQDKENKALKLLVEWAEECDFGFDQFHDEYERYKDEIKDMKYIDGMIHVAKRTLEDHGAFEEGR